MQNDAVYWQLLDNSACLLARTEYRWRAGAAWIMRHARGLKDADVNGFTVLPYTVLL